MSGARRATGGEEEVVRRFRARARADISAGGLRSLPSYQSLFPGHEDSIAAEYARLRAEDPPVRIPSSIHEDVRRLEADAGPPLPLLDEIARGGMGAVLRVRDERLGRDLAMKVLLGEEGRIAEPGGADDSTFIPSPSLRRFLQEAHLTAQLAHPGVPAVHALGVNAEGQVYFTMKLVRGRTLAEVFRLARDGLEDWTLTRALQVLIRVCETMAYAHSRGVIHRDLKPPNVMVGKFGEVYVMDWGLARAHGAVLDGGDPPPPLRAGPPDSPDPAATLPPAEALAGVAGTQADAGFTVAGTVLGTPYYMSPEQAAGRHDSLDARADVYSLGAMLYELLAGTPPYQDPAHPAMHPLAVVAAVREGPPRPLSALAPRAPVELAAIVARAMARQPDDRYPSAGDLADDLHRYIDGRTVRAHRTGPLVELRKWIGRNRTVATLAALTVVLVVGGAVAFAFQESEAAERFLGQKDIAERAADRAQRERARAEEAAERARAEAARAEGLRLCALSGMMAAEDPTLALLLAVEGATAAPGAAANDALFTAIRDHREIRTFVGHDAYVSLVIPCRGGRRVLSAEFGNQAILWDADSAAIVARFHGQTEFTALAVDAAGDRVVTAESGGRVAVWEGTTGRMLRTLPAGGADVFGLAVAADGARAVTGDVEGRIATWDLATGALLAEARPHGDAVVALAASDDLDGAVTVGSDGSVAAWNPSTGDVRWRIEGTGGDLLRPSTRRLQPDVPSVDVALGGERFLVQRRRRADLLGADGTVLRSVDDATRGCTGARGTRVAVARSDGNACTVEVWDARDGAVLTSDVTPLDTCDALALTPSGLRLAALRTGRADAWTWKAGGGGGAEILRGHVYAVTSIACLPDGRAITGANDATLRTWDLERSEDLEGVAWIPRRIRAVSRDATLALVDDGKREPWDEDDRQAPYSIDVVSTETGERLRTLPPVRPQAYAFFTDDGRTLGLGDSTGLRLLDVGTGAIVATFPAERFPVLARAVWANPDRDGSRFMINAGTPGNATGVLLERSGALRSFPRGILGPGAWSPDGRRYLVCNLGARTASIWDVEAGSEIHRLLGHTAFVMDGAWHPGGDFVVTTANDRRPRIWDPRTGAHLRTLEGLPMVRLPVEVSSDGVVLMAARERQQIDLFDGYTGTRLGRIRLPATAVGAWFLPDGRIAIREGSGRIRRWPVQPLALARSRVTRPLTTTERQLLEIGAGAVDGSDAPGRGPRATILARDAIAALRAGDAEAARAIVERGLALRPGFPDLMLARAYLHCAAADGLAAGTPAREAAVATGMAALEDACTGDPLDASILLREPLLEPLRADPRFAALVETVADEFLRSPPNEFNAVTATVVDLVADTAARFPARGATQVRLARIRGLHLSRIAADAPERPALAESGSAALAAAVAAGALTREEATADPLLAPLLAPR